MSLPQPCSLFLVDLFALLWGHIVAYRQTACKSSDAGFFTGLCCLRLPEVNQQVFFMYFGRSRACFLVNRLLNTVFTFRLTVETIILLMTLAVPFWWCDWFMIMHLGVRQLIWNQFSGQQPHQGQCSAACYAVPVKYFWCCLTSLRIAILNIIRYKNG